MNRCSKLGLTILFILFILNAEGKFRRTYQELNNNRSPNYCLAESYQANEKKTTEELINEYSEKYQVRADLVRCIIFNESGFRATAVGDSGKAVGLAQFHLGTWQSFRKQMGESQEDLRKDPEESIKTLVWALSQGYNNHWTPCKKGICQ
jgi:soluble lytic murein transglycosylase-like protein